MASPSNLRELRYLSGTTFNSCDDLEVASHASWAAGTATKLGITAYSESLEHEAVDDPEMQTDVRAHPGVIPTIKSGSFDFSIHAGCAESDEAANPEATLLSKVLGGIDSPAARTYAASGSHTTTTVQATNINNETAGALIVIGARGDGRGNGEARIVTAVAANQLTFIPAVSAAPEDDDQVLILTTVYYDEDADQQYLDFLSIGHATADQKQMAGCVATKAELTGSTPGEVPQFSFSMTPGDWQYVPSGERDQLEPGTAPSRNDPPVDRGLGGFFMGNWGASPRTAFDGSGPTVPNLAPNMASVPSQNGVNGMGGWCKVPAGDGFTATFSLLYDEDMLSLYDDDFVGQTWKYLIMQFGHSAEGVFVVAFPKCKIVGKPRPTELNGLSAVEITVRADWHLTGSTDLQQSPILLGWG